MNKLKRWEIEKIRDDFLENNTGRETQFDLTLLENNLEPNRENLEFKIVKEFNLNLGDKKVFLDDNDGSAHRGLEFSQLKFINKKPVYLIDNHNKALKPFFDVADLVGQKVNIVHIDAHRDDAVYPGKVEQITEGNLQPYLNTTRVSDYLDVAKRGGLVKVIVSITQSNEFENFQVPEEPYILNLDIDIYGPEGSYVDTKLKTEVILKAWQNAEAVVFATSPGFISNEDVKDLSDIFLNKI